MPNYSHLINPNYRHTYALIIYTTGEVYTSSCDEARYPLRTLLKRLDGMLREYGSAEKLKAQLINLNTNKIIMETI